jgi:hypothetical protein
MSKNIKKSLTVLQLNNPNTDDPKKEYSYIVINAKNTTKPRIHQRLREKEVQRLIKEGVDVKIRMER